MPLRAFVTLTFSAALAACASQMAAGLPSGKFVTLECAENKSFQARLSDDGRTVRVRAHAGAAELESRGGGIFAADGYVLNLRGEGGMSLEHDGKSQGKACRAA